MINIPFLELNITPKCNLSCVECSHYSGINTQIKEYTLTNILESIESIFMMCNRIGRLNVVGGEPFLRDDIGEIITKLSYYDIGKVTIVTNGTIIPSKHVLETLSKLDVFVGINNYSIKNNKSIILQNTLLEYCINNGINNTNYWISYGCFDKISKNALEKRNCNGHFFQLIHNKLFICPKALRGYDFNKYVDTGYDSIDLNGGDIEMILYNYINKKLFHICCTYCNRLEGIKKIPIAIQKRII